MNGSLQQIKTTDRENENTSRTNARLDCKDSIYYLPLYKAAINGDWVAAERIFLDDHSAITAKLSSFEETALHVAVSTGRCNFFVQKLIEKMPLDSLGIANKIDETPLHYAAIAGNTEAAKMLVRKKPELVQKTGKYGYTPLHRAAQYGQKETVSYLLSVNRNENPSPLAGKLGVKLLNLLITADFYDIAIDLLKCYPMLALEEDTEGNTALMIMARKPQAFGSGTHMGFFQFLLYHFFPGSISIASNAPKGGDVEDPSRISEEFGQENKQYACLQKIKDIKFMHLQAMELLRLLISEALKQSEAKVEKLLGNPVQVAATLGIHEFVTEIIRAYPRSVWLPDDHKRNIFHLAVLHRQEKVFNLLYQMSSYKHFFTVSYDKFGNNMLHLAGKLQPSNRISGAALQMQRELQWYKEVEKVVQPSFKEEKNKEGKTPGMVFSEEHKQLVEEGEKWMKDTASSYTLVAALMVTVVFAAAFTIPGGNDQTQGIPIFLNDKSFMIFAIADALALFSSSTSLLMFLSILTSRYAEEDFRRALPMRLSIGLITLFFSIASTLAAFSSSLHIVLSHRVRWIVVPIGLLACIPVTLFGLLQFPLLIAIVSSTFGPTIFSKQSEEIIL